ncbi:MAG TPA: SH3 domain-containing protein [Candidatus Wallbacteria bacterium]|nr:SH3 domain-containing protein [Candidatus Wallbacteria bacterium]
MNKTLYCEYFSGIKRVVFYSMAVVFAFVFSCAASLASAEESRIYSSKFEKGAITYIFGESTNVRKSDKISDGNVIDKLDAGQKVKILSEGSQYSIDGYTQSWYRVEYFKDGKSETGFVWGGFLSLASVFIGGMEKEGSSPVMAGIKKYDPKEGFIGELRLAADGKIISRAAFSPHNTGGGEKESAYSYGVSASISGPAGLSGVKNIIMVKCAYEACGYLNGTSYFGWDGKELFYITRDEYMSEAGCYDFEKKVIFPDDRGGEKGRVIIEENSREFDETKNDYFIKSSKKEIFEFKNNKLIKSGK